MLSGPGGGGCKLSDDWDRDGAESLLDDDGRVPLAACFLVRGILGGFWMGPYGRARQRCRRRVPIMATWRGVYWPWEHLRLVTTNYNYYRRGVCQIPIVRDLLCHGSSEFAVNRPYLE